MTPPKLDDILPIGHRPRRRLAKLSHLAVAPSREHTSLHSLPAITRTGSWPGAILFSRQSLMASGVGRDKVFFTNKEDPTMTRQLGHIFLP